MLATVHVLNLNFLKWFLGQILFTARSWRYSQWFGWLFLVCPYTQISQSNLSQPQPDYHRWNSHSDWKILSKIGSGQYCLPNKTRLYSGKMCFYYLRCRWQPVWGSFRRRSRPFAGGGSFSPPRRWVWRSCRPSSSLLCSAVW